MKSMLLKGDSKRRFCVTSEELLIRNRVSRLLSTHGVVVIGESNELS